MIDLTPSGYAKLRDALIEHHVAFQVQAPTPAQLNAWADAVDDSHAMHGGAQCEIPAQWTYSGYPVRIRFDPSTDYEEVTL